MNIGRPARLICCSVLILACSTAIDVPLAAAEATKSTDLVDEVMAYLGFDNSHRQSILDGEILFTGMPGLEPLPHAVAVAGAMMIVRRPWSELIEKYLSEDVFRSDPHLLDSGRIPDDTSNVSWTQDIAYTSAEHKELARMLDVKPGATFNFSASEIEKFSGITRDATADQQALALFRGLLAERIRDYLEQGLAGVQPYARAGGRQASPAEELAAALQNAEFLRRRFPVFHDALDRYPQGRDALSSSRLYWTKKDVSGRSTIALLHKTLWVGENAAMAAEREFYVGQGYNTMFTVVGAIPYDGGTLVLAANRTFAERVSGLGRRLKKTIGRKLVAAKFAERFEHLRSVLE
jgi:hypothetical protein